MFIFFYESLQLVVFYFNSGLSLNDLKKQTMGVCRKLRKEQKAHFPESLQ